MVIEKSRTTLCHAAGYGMMERFRYENTPHAISRKYFGCKNENFHWKKMIFVLFLLKTLIVGTR